MRRLDLTNFDPSGILCVPGGERLLVSAKNKLTSAVSTRVFDVVERERSVTSDPDDAAKCADCDLNWAVCPNVCAMFENRFAELSEEEANKRDVRREIAAFEKTLSEENAQVVPRDVCFVDLDEYDKNGFVPEADQTYKFKQLEEADETQGAYRCAKRDGIVGCRSCSIYRLYRDGKLSVEKRTAFCDRVKCADASGYGTHCFERVDAPVDLPEPEEKPKAKRGRKKKEEKTPEPPQVAPEPEPEPTLEPEPKAAPLDLPVGTKIQFSDCDSTFVVVESKPEFQCGECALRETKLCSRVVCDKMSRNDFKTASVRIVDVGSPRVENVPANDDPFSAKIRELGERVLYCERRASEWRKLARQFKKDILAAATDETRRDDLPLLGAEYERRVAELEKDEAACDLERSAAE